MGRIETTQSNTLNQQIDEQNYRTQVREQNPQLPQVIDSNGNGKVDSNDLFVPASGGRPLGAEAKYDVLQNICAAITPHTTQFEFSQRAQTALRNSASRFRLSDVSNGQILTVETNAVGTIPVQSFGVYNEDSQEQCELNVGPTQIDLVSRHGEQILVGSGVDAGGPYVFEINLDTTDSSRALKQEHVDEK